MCFSSRCSSLVHLVFASVGSLFHEKTLKEMDKLWNNGRFQPVLDKLEAFDWEDLTHTMIIYSLAKVLNLNKERVLESFEVTQEKYEAIEIKLISEKTYSQK